MNDLTLIKSIASRPITDQCAFCNFPSEEGSPFCDFCGAQPVDVEGVDSTVQELFELVLKANPESRVIQPHEVTSDEAIMMDCGCWSDPNVDWQPTTQNRAACPDCGSEVDLAPAMWEFIVSNPELGAKGFWASL